MPREGRIGRTVLKRLADKVNPAGTMAKWRARMLKPGGARLFRLQRGAGSVKDGASRHDSAATRLKFAARLDASARCGARYFFTGPKPFKLRRFRPRLLR
jgi:hypothetical protein